MPLLISMKVVERKFFEGCIQCIVGLDKAFAANERPSFIHTRGYQKVRAQML